MDCIQELDILMPIAYVKPRGPERTRVVSRIVELINGNQGLRVDDLMAYAFTSAFVPVGIAFGMDPLAWKEVSEETINRGHKTWVHEVHPLVQKMEIEYAVNCIG